MKKKHVLRIALMSSLIFPFSALSNSSAATPVTDTATTPTRPQATVAVTAQQPHHVPSKILNVDITTPQVVYHPNVVFTQVPVHGDSALQLRMDVRVPVTKDLKPAIIYIPGGGFISSNKGNYIQLLDYLSNRGYVVAAIEYRVAPQAQFPAPAEDCKTAIRYLKAHAKDYGIDPNRIGVIGGSAGGYLSAMMATTNGTQIFNTGDNLNYNSDIKAAVDLYGLSDLTKVGADFSPAIQAAHRSAGATEALWVNGSPVFGGRDGGINAYPEAAEMANPIHYISKTSAPMLLMHGDADTLVSPSQTDLLFQALQAHGIESERYIVHNAKHGGVYWDQEPVLKIIGDFFDAHLK